MNALLFSLLIIIVIILIFNTSTSIDPKKLDDKICQGWWYGSPEFCDNAEIEYMFLYLDGENSYIISGDKEGIIYNMQIPLKLINIKNTDTKGTYSIFHSINEPPFPNRSTLIIDRTNTSISIYKDKTLYAHLLKSN